MRWVPVAETSWGSFGPGFIIVRSKVLTPPIPPEPPAFPLPPPGQILTWLGGPIDIRVEVDTGLDPEALGLWDTALWDDGLWGSTDPAWGDVTPYVFAVDITGGVQRWGERFEAGSASITVDNTTGIFTPESDVLGFHLPFRPGRRIRVVAIPDAETGVKVPLFTGQVDSTNDAYDDAGHAITTAIVCTDFMTAWGAANPFNLEDPVGVELSSERVETVLDGYDWPAAARDIQEGNHELQPSVLSGSVLEEAQLAADAEGGAFFSDRDGNAVFKARDWLTTDDRSVNIQGYLGYTEIPLPGLYASWDVAQWDVDEWQGFEGITAHILSVSASWELARVTNHAKFSRVGGTVQLVFDLDSQGAYGIRTYEKTDLQNNLDADVAILANRYVTAFKDSRMRIDTVTISAVDDPGNDDLNRLMWDTRFGDRLALRIAPAWDWYFDKEVHVMAIQHNITASDWTVTFQLDDAQTYEEEEDA